MRRRDGRSGSASVIQAGGFGPAPLPMKREGKRRSFHRKFSSREDDNGRVGAVTDSIGKSPPRLARAVALTSPAQKTPPPPPYDMKWPTADAGCDADAELMKNFRPPRAPRRIRHDELTRMLGRRAPRALKQVETKSVRAGYKADNAPPRISKSDGEKVDPAFRKHGQSTFA